MVELKRPIYYSPKPVSWQRVAVLPLKCLQYIHLYGEADTIYFCFIEYVLCVV